ncbi:MAG: YceD family protein [Solirubrobacterales bacterium]
MKIDVSDLFKKKSARKDLNFTVNLDGFNYGEEYIKIISPLKFNGTLSTLGDLLELQGCVNGTVELTCSRCLVKFPMELDIQVYEKLSNDMETVDKDEESVFIDGDTLDITEIMLNNIILYLPIKRLCKDDCEGLCQKCGTNLNISSCNCTSDEIDPRLAKLKDFFD